MRSYSIDYLNKRYAKLRKLSNTVLPLSICALALGIMGLVPIVAMYTIELIKVLDGDGSPASILIIIFGFIGLLIFDSLFIIAGVAGIVIRSTLLRMKLNSTKKLIDRYYENTEVIDNPEVVN